MSGSNNKPLLERLTHIQKRQNWRDRALLKLVVDYIETHTSVSWDLLTQHIQNVADEDNERFRQIMNKQKTQTTTEVPHAH